MHVRSVTRGRPLNTSRSIPALTITVATLTGLASIAGLVVEPIEHALRRDAAAISSGELWRLLSSLLVQDGGLLGTVFNLGGLVLVGTAAERRLGRRSWAFAYLAGGLTGELVGWAGWQPIGAGNSVGVCGLAGALAIATARGASPPEPLEAIAPALWAAALASGTLTIVAPITAALLGSAVAAGRAGPVGRVLLLLLVVGSAVTLSVRSDIHGAALSAGLLVGVCRYSACMQDANDGDRDA